jgi:hypothetical protein
MNKIYTAAAIEFTVGLERLLNHGWELTHLEFYPLTGLTYGFAVLRRKPCPSNN